MKDSLTKLLIVLGLLVGVAGIYFLPYINRYFTVSSIRFVVPDGYRGMFCIREHTDGIDNNYSEDGRIIYEVPPQGLLDVRDASPLQLTNSNICITRSGRVFSELPWPAKPPFKDRVGFSGVSVTSRGQYWFLIGTERDLYEYFNGRDKYVGGIKDECVQEDKTSGIH